MCKFLSASFATIVASLALAQPAVAQTCTSQQCQGTIESVESTNDYYSFRVKIVGVAAMCAGGPAWAFVNVNDANYKSHVSNLLLGGVDLQLVVRLGVRNLQRRRLELQLVSADAHGEGR
jgi:hypothetical protein